MNDQRRERLERGFAVPVNMRRCVDTELIKWAKERNLFARVDRGSIWGNPFRARNRSEVEHTRVVSLYREWLSERPELLEQIDVLKGKALACWCAPLPCHAEVLCSIVNATQ